MGEVKVWAVRYSRTCEGTALVDAETAEEARAAVEAGDFDADTRGEEQVDWEAIGAAKEEQ